MTLAKSLELILARVGLNTTATPFKDRARDYWNEGAKVLSGERQWQWLFKQSTLTLAAGTRNYSLASDVSRPLSFRHTTDDAIMDIIDVQAADRAAPGSDESGSARAVYITGRDSTTGYWNVDLVPTPDTASETVTYRYFAVIADKTSSNDAADLLTTLPEDGQWALIDYATGRYKGELGDSRGEQEEMDAYRIKVDAMKKVDGETDGNESFRLPRRDAGFPHVILDVRGTIS